MSEHRLKSESEATEDLRLRPRFSSKLLLAPDPDRRYEGREDEDNVCRGMFAGLRLVWDGMLAVLPDCSLPDYQTGRTQLIEGSRADVQ